MEKILSIIIPTYNAEKFLDKGLTSFIMKDTKKMDKLEVLVINDGSPDNSVAIAQKYADQYPQTFAIVNKENGGHGSAINEGVRHIRGKYFKVIDADDWVDTAALERLMDILEVEEFDAMIASYTTYDISKDEYESRKVRVDDYNRMYQLPELMERWDDIYLGLSFHGVLYNTKFYKNQNYWLVEHAFYEDQEYATIPLSWATRIRVLDDELYIYRIGDVNQSVSTESQLRRLPDFEKVLWKMLEFESRLDELPSGGADHWARKLSKYMADIYQITLVKNPDKKGKRRYIKELNQKLRVKSPYIYNGVKNKYRVFVILNRLHMSDEVYNKQFANLLEFGRKHFHVNKLYK